MQNMFTLLFTAALAAAAPAQAAAPADAHKDHAQHGQMDHEGHDMPCCKDGKADCCKDKSKMDCCKQAEKTGKAQTPAEGHSHQH